MGRDKEMGVFAGPKGQCLRRWEQEGRKWERDWGRVYKPGRAGRHKHGLGETPVVNPGSGNIGPGLLRSPGSRAPGTGSRHCGTSDSARLPPTGTPSGIGSWTGTR